MNPDDYEFYSEDQKLSFIQNTFFDHMYHCPNCGESYTDEDGALNCCHEDCYEQDKSFIEEEMADTRLRMEKGD